MSKLILATDVEKQLRGYAHHCNKEIGAFGYITMQDGHFYVDEVFLVPQEVSGTSVDYVSEGFMYAIQKATNDERLNDLRFAWHSHVNMGAFFSSTDESMVRTIRDAGALPWFVSLVTNKKNETYARLDIFKNGLNELPGLMQVSEVRLDVCSADQVDQDERIISEIEKFVAEKKYTAPKGKGKKGGKGKGKGGSSTGASSNQTAMVVHTPSSPTSAPQELMAEPEKQLSDMTEAELERELEWAQAMYATARRHSWEGYADSDGWMFWFSGDSFTGSCMSLETPEQQ